MLQVADIHVYYGDSHVLQGVSLNVHAAEIVALLGRIIAGFKSEIPVLLSEQNAFFALSVADRGYVIDKGVIRYAGNRQDLINNTEVQSRYLSV
jgi:branched-chain amino acid transport system ATP-binding protein